MTGTRKGRWACGAVVLCLAVLGALLPAATAAAATVEGWYPPGSCGHTRPATAAETTQFGVPEGETGIADAVLNAAPGSSYYQAGCAPTGWLDKTSDYAMVDCTPEISNCFWFVRGASSPLYWFHVALVRTTDTARPGTPGSPGGPNPNGTPDTGCLPPGTSGAGTGGGFEHVVILTESGGGSDPARVTTAKAHAREHAACNGLNPELVLGAALVGYVATMTDSVATAIKARPGVRVVIEDSPSATRPFERESQLPQTPQSVPTHIRRTGADLSSTISGDGTGTVDADIAVIDSGVDPAQADLNVAGGVDCVPDGVTSWGDEAGHGTAVAGVAAAKDNGINAVGVAPGARIWAVKAADAINSPTTGSVLCGVDWVAEHADVIDVVNYSGGSFATPPVGPGCTTTDPLHDAICALDRLGVPFVTITQNSSTNMVSDTGKQLAPATYLLDNVITTSGLADYDGLPGGLSTPTCPAGTGDADDSFDDYAGYGVAVDVIAPSVCLTSTGLGGGLTEVTGTSYAAPQVAGALALWKSENPAQSVAELRARLVNHGTRDWNSADDPDGVQEPLLNLRP